MFILVLLEKGCFDYMSAFGANYRRQILNCPLKHIDVNNNLPFLYSKAVHTYCEVRRYLHISNKAHKNLGFFTIEIIQAESRPYN